MSLPVTLPVFRKIFAIAFLSATLGLGADLTLDAVLSHVDQASAGFKGLTANIRKVAHTGAVDKDDIDSGTIIVKRAKPHDTHLRIDLKDPSQKTVTIGDGKLVIFSPLTNEAQTADLGKDRNLVDQFFLLGFGSNSSELKASYDVTLGGSETIEGQNTSRLVLVPKDKELLIHVKRCELWISDKGVTVQQKFYTGNKDYQLATYSHIVFNPVISDAAVKLILPHGVKFTKLK
jgi:outer membrane lipoprotein-sorting protein